jgi:hypothetical protein
MTSYSRETRSLEELWRTAHTVARVIVDSVGQARTTLPDGRTPTEDDADWLRESYLLPAGAVPVTPVGYDIQEIYKGELPSVEWWSGGQLDHPPRSLYFWPGETAIWLPKAGMELVLFKEAGTIDWSGGRGTQRLETRPSLARFELTESEAVYVWPKPGTPDEMRTPRFPKSQFLEELRLLASDSS